MSRLGKKPIIIEKGAEVTFVDNVISVKGPKGTLSLTLDHRFGVEIKEGELEITPKTSNLETKALWGTYASLIKSMIKGVVSGYEKKLEIEGVGYKAEVKGKKVVLALGFSHPVEVEIPAGIEVIVEKSLMTIKGFDKGAVGQFAASIRALKKPEPYKGKGIHYVGEYIRRKQGKKAV